MRKPEGYAWRPTPEHELLLKAALLDGEAALRAWAAFRERTPVEEIDDGATRLLGLVYRNLSRLQPDVAELAKLKGWYRHAWFRNQTVQRSTSEMLAALHERGIPTLMLKGVPLTLLHYRDAGARQMNDVDVLVPPARATEAVAVLRDLGAAPWNTPMPEKSVRVGHAEAFRRPDGFEIDLHWLSHWLPSDDEGLWSRAVPLEVGEVVSRAPAPTDLLVGVCGHGAAWAPEAPVRWAADAVTIMRSGPVDWELLLREARRRRMSLPLADTLGWVREHLRAPVPEGLLDELRATLPSRLERATYATANRAPSPPVVLRTALLRWRWLRTSDVRIDVSRDPVSFFYRWACQRQGVTGPVGLGVEALRFLRRSLRPRTVA